jgi:hypothetical protein
MRLRLAGTALLLIGTLCNAKGQAAAHANDAELYSQLIRAEMKAGHLGQQDTVCLVLPNYSDPSKSLLKALRSSGLAVQKTNKCLFRGYEIRLVQGAPSSIRVQLVDVRYVGTDLAVILRDGVYVIEKSTTGKWNTRDYKPFQATLATARSDEVSEVSQALVGKQITIHGKFSLWGKVGPYIVLSNQQAVYLEAKKGSFTWGKPYSEMEGKLVTATGTLRFYHEPPLGNTPNRPVNVQRVEDHFYFEVETAQLRLNP